jgi:excinuclease ABC subunit C
LCGPIFGATARVRGEGSGREDRPDRVHSDRAAEALFRATLVKRNQPFFNVRLKDDKHYPYLKIDLREPWPRVEIARRVRADGARYFGPFASPGSVRRSLDLVKKLFPWRSCTKEITGNDPRPCLEYFIHPDRAAPRCAKG